MSVKPDLIVFSQNLLGGGASFHRNMLAHLPKDFFDIKCVYLNPTHWHGAKALETSLNDSDVIFSYGKEPVWATAKKLSKLIPNTEGVIVSNLEQELTSLDLYRKPLKTVYFICHDSGFLHLAVNYESIIDVFIAHNIAVYEEIKNLLPWRKEDVFFIQHGVSVQPFQRQPNANQNIKMVFLARHHAFKGIFDLPVIDELLRKQGVQVDWMILGDGPERGKLIETVKDRPNFRFNIPQNTAEVIATLKQQDVFILPSRSDGLPVALLESMSVGCVPVLANFSEGIKKVVTEDIGFVVPVGDNEQFAEKISKLAADRALLQQLSTNCVAKIKEEFNIEKQALEYYKLYKDYQRFRKKHRLDMKGIRRMATYFDSYNKLVSISKRVKKKLSPGKK